VRGKSRICCVVRDKTFAGRGVILVKYRQSGVSVYAPVDRGTPGRSGRDLEARPHAAGGTRAGREQAGVLFDRAGDEGENPSIGIILRRQKRTTIVEYALRDDRKPIGVAWIDAEDPPKI
jgi:hypothetical protein